MTPRPYRLGQRQAAVDGTRARILAAARDLLAAEAGVSAFTVDAIAEQAGVARMTVYYQFESKRGLLEALFDHFANRGLVQPLRAAFERSEPLEALDAFVAAFCGFWASDRVALRRNSRPRGRGPGNRTECSGAGSATARWAASPSGASVERAPRRPTDRRGRRHTARADEFRNVRRAGRYAPQDRRGLRSDPPPRARRSWVASTTRDTTSTTEAVMMLSLGVRNFEPSFMALNPAWSPSRSGCLRT